MDQKDLRQSSPFVEFIQKIGWVTEPIGKGEAFIKKLPLGTVIKINRLNPPIPYTRIDQLAKKYKALFVKIEPNSFLDSKLEAELKKHGFEMDNWTFAPTKTILVNLKPSEEAILRSFEKDTRYSIRLAERKGVSIEESVDIEKFLKLFKETAKRKGFWTGSIQEIRLKYLSFLEAKKALLLFAFTPEEKTPIAAALTYFEGKNAYYYHAASLPKHREFMAPYLLVWETIKQAKRKGATTLDLEGTHDPRIPSTKNWKGFTHFKKGFGEEVTYVGSFSKFYNPVIRLIFKFGSLF